MNLILSIAVIIVIAVIIFAIACAILAGRDDTHMRRK